MNKENEDIIKLTALLTKATCLLLQAREDKQFALKSLEVPFKDKKELTPETLEWLKAKNQKSIDDIECNLTLQSAPISDDYVSILRLTSLS